MEGNRSTLVYIALFGLAAAIGLVQLALDLGGSVAAALDRGGVLATPGPLAQKLGQFLLALALAVVALVALWDRARGRAALQRLTLLFWAGAILSGVAWFMMRGDRVASVWPLMLTLVGVAAPSLLEQGIRWLQKQEDIAQTGGPERVVRAEITINAGVKAVWEVWATPEGIRSFLAPDCRMEPRPGGPYEAFFDPQAHRGQRGSEGSRILALQPPTFLSLSWSPPASLPDLREERTHVVIRLEEMALNQAKVSVIHDGWGQGPDWDQAYQHALGSWSQLILPRLRYRFAVGPIDWDHPPGGLGDGPAGQPDQGGPSRAIGGRG